MLVRLHGLKPSIPLSANATDIVSIAFVVTEHVGAVEHHDPGVMGMVFESGRRPVAQRVPKRNVFAHNRTQLLVEYASIEQRFEFGHRRQPPIAFTV